MKVTHANGSNVILLKPKAEKLKYPALTQVEAYWTALADSGAIPRRSQIDPRGLEDVLDYAFILERVAPGVARFRIAGRHLVDLMGMEVRGMPLTAMFEPETRNTVSNMVERVCKAPAVITISLDGGSDIGRGPLRAKMILAPLRSDAGHVNRLLGCLQSEGQIGRQPRRFTITNEEAETLTPIIEYPPVQDQPRRLNQLAETQAEFVHKSKTEKPGETRPALRLVSDNG